MKKQKLMLGDNITSLKKLPDNSIDSVVTDPPYGLSFMGKKWDYDVPSVEFWQEVYRVLKPGGHILSFGGTRTYHRMVVNIEDAGFEIRDQIQWLYGSGFPKSLNVGKAVDKLEGNERKVIGEQIIPYKDENRSILQTKDGWNDNSLKTRFDITKGQSEWEGWGSALKPANEPICLARKPLSEKSIAENVLKWRTGGLNIDGCRVDVTINDIEMNKRKTPKTAINIEQILWETKSYKAITDTFDISQGRFPANLILDETAAEMLDEQSGVSGSKSSIKKTNRQRSLGNICYGDFKDEKVEGIDNYGDSGGASRFFYVAKVSKAERNMGLDGFEDKGKGWSNYLPPTTNGTSDIIYDRTTTTKNTHPTVKPVNLMSYLCKLITPPNGIVLDPFMGSGSTGISALLNDFRFVGMEMDSNYFKIAEARINNYEDYKKFLKK